MKATLLLRKDHEKVQELFDRLQRGTPLRQSKIEVFEEIQRVLSLHCGADTEIFFSEMVDTGTSATTAALIEALTEDHRKIERILEETAKVVDNDKLFESEMERLLETVRLHIQREEEDLFSEARRIFPEHRLEEIGLEIEQRRSFMQVMAA